MDTKPTAEHILKIRGEYAALLSELAVREDRTLTAQLNRLIREGHARYMQEVAQ